MAFAASRIQASYGTAKRVLSEVSVLVIVYVCVIYTGARNEHLGKFRKVSL